MAAQSWFANRTDAHRQGITNLTPFYNDDVILDHRARDTEPVRGRQAALQHLHEVWEPSDWQRRPTRPVYVSTEGAVTVERILDLSPQLGYPPPGDAAFIHRMSTAGITEEVYAPSLQTWQRAAGAKAPEDPRHGDVRALADAYWETWSQGSTEHASSLYARDAALDDTILEVGLRGRSDVLAATGQPPAEGGLSAAKFPSAAPDGAIQVFAAGSHDPDEPMDHLVLLATVEDPTCPHPIAIAIGLELDAKGRITHEERYHRVDTLLRCAATRPAPSGWWDSTPVPDPVPVTATGTVVIGSRTVEVYNGSEGLERLLTWAGSRFPDSGLTTPAIKRVTFHDHDVDLCRGVNGQILGGDITLCYRDHSACADDGCTTWKTHAKATLLHEMGHAWIDENVDDETQEEFLAVTGLPTWDDTTQPWGQRGVEIAAETISWALMDEEHPFHVRLGPLTCADLADAFEVLTGFPPRDEVPCLRTGPPALR